MTGRGCANAEYRSIMQTNNDVLLYHISFKRFLTGGIGTGKASLRRYGRTKIRRIYM